MEKKLILRRKSSETVIQKALQKLYGRSYRIKYDPITKYWWIQVEGSEYDPFPRGRWLRADYFFSEDYELAVVEKLLEANDG